MGLLGVIFGAQMLTVDHKNVAGFFTTYIGLCTFIPLANQSAGESILRATRTLPTLDNRQAGIRVNEGPIERRIGRFWFASLVGLNFAEDLLRELLAFGNLVASHASDDDAF